MEELVNMIATDASAADISDQIKDILCNPLYTGMGDFGRVISEKEFITAGEKLIKEIGAKEYLKRMLEILRATL